MRKTLYLFTTWFPYSNIETYLETEIEILSKKFNKIYIIPINIKGTARNLPPNCEVLDLHSKVKYTPIVFHLFDLIRIYMREYIHTEYKWDYLRKCMSAIKSIYNAKVYATALHDVLNRDQNSTPVFYTYWFYHWALVCSVATYKGYIPSYFSRAHLVDLYELNSKINFTNFKLKHIKKLFLISNHGQEYFVQHYPRYQSKYEKHYLGTMSSNIINQKKEILSDYTIVSCSAVRPVKKVDKIFKVINELNFPLKWIHFGSGPLFDELQSMVLNNRSHIEVELKGHISNFELLKFYATHHVDLFINLSEEEGLPVSIMEAQSFGIPVLATDVFATSEAVVNGTGVLVKTDEDIYQISKKIEELRERLTSGEITPTKIIEHWNLMFNAEKNYQKVTDILIHES